MKFRVEQYEIWAQAYVVEADDPSDAVRKVIEGEIAPSVERSDLDYITVAEDYSQPLPLMDGEEVFSIRSVEAVEPDRDSLYSEGL